MKNFMGSIHSETLFHFCEKLEYIEGILRSQAFHPSHARENISAGVNMDTLYY